MATASKPATADPVSLAALLAAGKKVAPDAVELLIQDHREVESFFASYDLVKDKAAKALLVTQICLALKAHMQVEEEIFYPEAATATGDRKLVEHAIQEHEQAKGIIADLESGSVDDRNVQALRKAIEEHVQEEETKLFPEVRETGLDLYEIGALLAARRVETLQELTGKGVPLS